MKKKRKEKKCSFCGLFNIQNVQTSLCYHQQLIHIALHTHTCQYEKLNLPASKT